jgi:PadR family transcriptional regulator, regulatory protein AphA
MTDGTTASLAALEYVMLGLVQQPTHAYEMFRQFGPALPLGMIWHLKQSHLYALLARLEQMGYVTATVESQGARPPRRVLRLTEAGRAALESWLATPVAHGRDIRQEFLAKLYFTVQRGPEVARALVTAQEAVTRTWRDEAQAQFDVATQPYAQLVLRYRLGQIDATFTWLAECATTIIQSASIFP